MNDRLRIIFHEKKLKQITKLLNKNAVKDTTGDVIGQSFSLFPFFLTPCDSVSLLL